MGLTHAFHTDKPHSLDHPVARDQPLLLFFISYIFPPSLLALKLVITEKCGDWGNSKDPDSVVKIERTLGNYLTSSPTLRVS